MRATLHFLALIVGVLLPPVVGASEPWPPIPRRLPPPGIEIPAADRLQLAEKLSVLKQRRDLLAEAKNANAEQTGQLLVDVDIYLKAVRFALEESEFFRKQDVASAHKALEAAEQRLDELSAGKPSWPEAHGLVVRGYRSAVDDSVQPYGLVIPASLKLEKPVALYVWLHGRGDTLADLQFISERGRSPGQVAPSDAIVLHPFGRSCLGWKGTAEVDVFEAIDSVASRYPIDPQRIVLMGFSMGGAGAWHIGAHYADRFAAVHAGAGFVDVKRYQHLADDALPPVYEQRLWGLYDVPRYVRNFFNVPIVAYSGEVDKQKDAADFMAEEFQGQGRKLLHLIGPGLGHKYDPAVLMVVMQRMQEAATHGRQSQALSVSLQTQTLRYNRMHWVEALELDHHWQDSRIDAEYVGPDTLSVTTKNIQSLRLSPPKPVRQMTIDGQPVAASGETLVFEKHAGQWAALDGTRKPSQRKRPGLQGPIDDAFQEPFVVVVPSGTSSPELDRWVAFELDHFLRRWKNVYRAEPRVVRDVDLKASDIEKYHLICWGDAKSNAVLRKVHDGLPLGWREGKLRLGSVDFDDSTHLPLAISPNPLNPERYLVINSGPTHREFHDRTNSLQNPKLGDWAIVDVTVMPTDEQPGRIATAGFFDEEWNLSQ